MDHRYSGEKICSLLSFVIVVIMIEHGRGPGVRTHNSSLASSVGRGSCDSYFCFLSPFQTVGF